MTPTTTYGSWANFHSTTGDFDEDVRNALGDGVSDFDIDGVSAAYRHAINTNLEARGISQAGNEFHDAPILSPDIYPGRRSCRNGRLLGTLSKVSPRGMKAKCRT